LFSDVDTRCVKTGSIFILETSLIEVFGDFPEFGQVPLKCFPMDLIYAVVLHAPGIGLATNLLVGSVEGRAKECYCTTKPERKGAFCK
jgi:hypothetical protein